MKQRILTFSLVALFMSATVFTGCKKDSGPAPALPTPTITLNSGAGFNSTSATVAPGTVLNFGVVAAAVSGSTLTNFKVAVAYDGGAAQVLLDSTFKSPGASLTWQRSFKARTVAGSEVYSFTVTDKNGETAGTSVTITTAASAATTTQSGMLLGAVSNTNGSFYSTSGPGGVYKESAVTASTAYQNIVDFAYFYTTTGGASIGSVDDASVSGSTGAYPNSGKWTNRNTTYLGMSTYTASDFDNITADKIAAIVVPTSKMVNSLGVGSVIAFQNKFGKKGLIKVTGLNSTGTGASGDITITVKVQQ
jgi:hypothetical protein